MSHSYSKLIVAIITGKHALEKKIGHAGIIIWDVVAKLKFSVLIKGGVRLAVTI